MRARVGCVCMCVRVPRHQEVGDKVYVIVQGGVDLLLSIDKEEDTAREEALEERKVAQARPQRELVSKFLNQLKSGVPTVTHSSKGRRKDKKSSKQVCAPRPRASQSHCITQPLTLCSTVSHPLLLQDANGKNTSAAMRWKGTTSAIRMAARLRRPNAATAARLAHMHRRKVLQRGIGGTIGELALQPNKTSRRGGAQDQCRLPL